MKFITGQAENNKGVVNMQAKEFCIEFSQPVSLKNSPGNPIAKNGYKSIMTHLVTVCLGGFWKNMALNVSLAQQFSDYTKQAKFTGCNLIVCKQNNYRADHSVWHQHPANRFFS